MKKSMKQRIFPTPPGWTEEQNDEAIRSFLSIISIGLVVAFAAIGYVVWETVG